MTKTLQNLTAFMLSHLLFTFFLDRTHNICSLYDLVYLSGPSRQHEKKLHGLKDNLNYFFFKIALLPFDLKTKFYSNSIAISANALAKATCSDIEAYSLT